MKRAAALACVALAACQPAARSGPEEAREGAPAASRETLPAPDPASTIPQDISGEYRVAGIDGEPLDAEFGIAVSIDGETISFEPTCHGFAWTYRYQAGTLALAKDPRFGPQSAPDGSATSCLSAVPPEYRALARAFAAADAVRRTPANALEFTGNGHSVTLFSQ